MATEHAQNNAPEMLKIYCRVRLDRIREEVEFLRDIIVFLESGLAERNPEISKQSQS